MMEEWKQSSAPLFGKEPHLSHVTELYLPQEHQYQRFGFRISGSTAGPNIVVACQDALARRVYQRILLIPSLNRIKGHLFLISSDRLGNLRELESLRGLLGVDGPIDHIMTLPAVKFDTLNDTAVTEAVRQNYFAVLRLCAQMGMVQGRGIPDWDALLS